MRHCQIYGNEQGVDYGREGEVHNAVANDEKSPTIGLWIFSFRQQSSVHVHAGVNRKRMFFLWIDGSQVGDSGAATGTERSNSG